MEQVAPSLIRSSLGMSIRQFARIVMCSHTTVSRWERGLSQPYPIYRSRLRQLWRAYHRSQSHRWPARVAYVRLERMRYYRGKPGAAWHHWTWKQRLSFMAHRERYRRLVRDAAAGRVFIQYIDVAYDDDARLDIAARAAGLPPL